MRRRANAPVYKTIGQTESGQVRIRPGPVFFLQAENCPRVQKSLSDFCLSAFLVGLVTVASDLSKILAF